MSYNYADQRPELFTERGTATLLQIKDNALRLIGEAGAVRAQEAFAGISGDSWLFLAALDYLVETGVIREVVPSQPVWGQHRIFTTIGQ